MWKHLLIHFLKHWVKVSGLHGYTAETLKQFVPALVYTMYDGYYIYTPYNNYAPEPDRISSQYENDYNQQPSNAPGLKPYVYYTEILVGAGSGGTDVVVNYTLDNYITVYGIFGGQYMEKAGYLIYDPSHIPGSAVGGWTYKGVAIGSEVLRENVIAIDQDNNFWEAVRVSGVPAAQQDVNYVYYEGVKNYNYRGSWHTIDGEGLKLSLNAPAPPVIGSPTIDTSAIDYITDAIDFTTWVTANLGGGNPVFNFNAGTGNDPEDPNSLFNRRRRETIKNSIQENLEAVFQTFNNAGGASYDFRLPEIEETKWDMIIDNICIVSFLQGMPIGKKYYNGYFVVANNINKEFINKNAIYISHASR